MEELFAQVYSNGALLIMWGALLVHLILPFPREAHPVTLWHKFAELLAEKVNLSHSHSQSIISGTLAWLLMLVPSLLVLLALKPLVWKVEFFEMALLLLAIDWRNTDTFSRRFTQAMAREDKESARQLLSPFVNRSTDSLSLLGLGKAGAETLIMAYGRNVVCVLFWYAIGGGIAAFIYRLTMELARAWSPSRQKFYPFGLPVVKTVAMMEFVPMRIFSLFIMIGSRAASAWQLIRQQAASWPLPGPAWLLVAVGAKLELSLGGPAMYHKKKSVRVKIGGRIAPAAIHLSQINSMLIKRMSAWILIQSLLLLAIYQGI
ncbi:cobalamin biosynthesis family protein [Vibrio sonorensis]|uniref:cobalamin biosynthesis family protein n=1 Tax=Vibrio sonorensis TaxID=1004316 RepID=UPI0008D9C645|nr:cobalamin biosynthesis family protein [Vibrio sonorensis]